MSAVDDHHPVAVIEKILAVFGGRPGRSVGAAFGPDGIEDGPPFGGAGMRKHGNQPRYGTAVTGQHDVLAVLGPASLLASLTVISMSAILNQILSPIASTRTDAK
jgi:hypothetical protein